MMLKRVEKAFLSLFPEYRALRRECTRLNRKVMHRDEEVNHLNGALMEVLIELEHYKVLSQAVNGNSTREPALRFY